MGATFRNNSQVDTFFTKTFTNWVVASEDLGLFMDVGTLYDLLDDYTIQQIMNGAYNVAY